MASVGFIEHKGVRILRIEFIGDLTNDRVREIMDEAKKLISSQPQGSVRTLTILGEFHFDTQTAVAFREYIEHNKPYVKAGAVIGVAGLRKALYNSLMFLTRRDVRICNSEEEAKEYLAGA